MRGRAAMRAYFYGAVAVFWVIAEQKAKHHNSSKVNREDEASEGANRKVAKARRYSLIIANDIS